MEIEIGISQESEGNEKHNALVEKIRDAGFKIPVPNPVTRFRVGHVEVLNPRLDHPTTYHRTVGEVQQRAIKLNGDLPVPVAYISYGKIFLVNTEYPQLSDYHTQLRGILRVNSSE